MKTELKGAFQSGFKLTEKDVRRIVDIVIDKMKPQPNQTVTRKINYKLANGANRKPRRCICRREHWNKKDYLFGN
jgi:hypothetical protein